MARTPLFDSLHRALRIAAVSLRDRRRSPPLDELIDMRPTRRRFLRDTAVTSAVVATGALAIGCRKERETRPTAARVAIVGAGMAGLNAAYKLRKAGLVARIYEGSDRTGGRIFTARDLLAEGLTTELGGEFIDSSHEEMLALVDEFGFERLDTQSDEAASLTRETYFIDGRHHTLAQAAKAFVPLAERILADYDSMGEVVDYQTEGGGGAFDRMSLTEYLDRLEARGWLRELLEVAYVTEYGLDAGEQSALNFIFLIGTGDLSDPSAFEVLGESDERYKVRGGNQQLVDELARRVEGQIEKRHRLEAIRPASSGFRLVFQTDSGTREQDAEVVILALPFSLLREVDLQIELPPLKRRAIQELAYGHNAKLLVGFHSRPWQALGYAGSTYSDESFQLAWDNSFLQPGSAGGLTLYSGGNPGLAAGEGTAEAAAAKLLVGIERAYPGATAALNGKTSRFHWPTFPWTRGSYSCYKPGQWTTIAGSEGQPVGNLHFAGEHCSYDFQGYMNGAAQSGLDTARAVMGQLSGADAVRAFLRRRATRVA